MLFNFDSNVIKVACSFCYNSKILILYNTFLMSIAKQKLIILETVDSTNNYAMALVQNGSAINGDTVFAMEQTKGRGTRGKQWKSNKGENIMMSMMAEMQWQPIHQQFPLSVASAVGCLEFVLNYAKEHVTIKWPNDIFIGDSKAGGILIENVIRGNLWQWAVIGIGINVNQDAFKEDNLCATSLKLVSGKSYDVIALAKELQEIFFQKIDLLQSGGFIELLQKYNDYLFRKNQTVKLKNGSIQFETTIVQVSQSGKLITRDAIERSFNFGEIEWLNN